MAKITKIIETNGVYRGQTFAGQYSISSSREIAFVKVGSQWTYAEWNPYHQNWVAGNAYGRTIRQAVNYATYLPRRRSIKSLIEDFLTEY